MDKYYGNQPSEDWEKFFKQYDKTSFEGEGGLKRVYSNSVEELYQMFKARLQAEGKIT